jgi:20S proteasome subunit beta 2
MQVDKIAGGFSFENHARNITLQQKGLTLPRATKTGTTIAGVIFKASTFLYIR